MRGEWAESCKNYHIGCSSVGEDFGSLFDNVMMMMRLMLILMLIIFVNSTAATIVGEDRMFLSLLSLIRSIRCSHRLE